MASMHAARLGGDRYQHHYSWWLILALKLPEENVQKVIVENGQAGQVDDVTVHYNPETTLPDRFYQIKYHVDQRETYSSESLIAAKDGDMSLLKKFWSTWNKLREKTPGRNVELYLISTWTWNDTDPLGDWVSGVTDKIKVDEFMAESPRSKIGKIRSDWQLALGASNEDFRAFIDCLHFRFGYSASVLLGELVSERMKRLRLKTDPTTLKAIQGIVSDWIITGQHEITLERLNETLLSHTLYLPKEEERGLTIYLDTIETGKYAREADYQLDWTEDFIKLATGLRRHQLNNPTDWNNKLLPQLYALKKRVRQENDCRLIRAYGQARLSPWFAFGHAFSEVAGYTIEFDHKGQPWRSDVAANKDFSLLITNDRSSPAGEIIHRTGGTVAVAISITDHTNDIGGEIRRSLLANEGSDKVAALLLLRSERPTLRDSGDAVALADSVKSLVGAFVRQHNANRLLLFYFGPASGACFIGRKLNKVCPEIQIMEYQAPGYAPSFLLT